MSVANLSATVAAQFKLSAEERETVKFLLDYDVTRRKRYSDFVSAAQAAPSVAAQIRQTLLVDIATAGGPPTTPVKPVDKPVDKPADKPKTTRKRAAKSAQTVPANKPPLPTPVVTAKPARKPIALCAAPLFNDSVAWDGSAPPVAGSKVWYEDSTNWEDYAPAVKLPAPPATKPEPKETSVTVDARDIPDSPSKPEYKLPWVQGASLYEKTGAVYVRFGSGRRSVSLLASELMETLKRADELRSLVATLEARVG